MMLTVPQLEMFTGTGATKSLISAVNDAEERLRTNALPKASQVPAGKTPAAVRLMAVSPNVSPGRSLGAPGLIGSVTVSVLTAAIAVEAPRAFLLPQHGTVLLEKHWLAAPLVTQVSSPIVGLPPPLVKSKVTSRSPAVRLSVFGPVVVRSGWVFWLISKSKFAEPRTLVRSQARYR